MRPRRTGGVSPAQVEEELKRRVEEREAEGVPGHQYLDVAFNLGLWYLHGRFQGKKDVEQGLKMVEVAQRGGHARAVTWYGICHRLGVGMKRRDPSRARFSRWHPCTAVLQPPPSWAAAVRKGWGSRGAV